MAAEDDFGTDFSGITDLDARCSTVTGRRLLAEAIARRLSTPRGRLIKHPDYGTDLTEYINDDIGPGDLAAMQSAIVAECLKDERVQDVDVSITAPVGGVGEYLIELSIDDGDGPFDLTLSVGEVSVELLSATLDQ